MQTINVNGYDMAYLDVGEGPTLVCVHGSLCDFRIWSSVLGPLTRNHRVIAPTLRHFFPDHWDGVGDTSRSPSMSTTSSPSSRDWIPDRSI